ncbi:hypothetical protein K402DRAFT_396377 [Aulographum hederae CBS 113979]|uniref:Uncharacterized protein n=1 Tax=Aulographum hederae CBS 113979 TaxID=1176131 RepID=A0A6G1GS35_9PEZI|nr:hypothetical protein K402DRAFT_396377 [Aulographum hederae CBS 113979]
MVSFIAIFVTAAAAAAVSARGPGGVTVCDKIDLGGTCTPVTVQHKKCYGKPFNFSDNIRSADPDKNTICMMYEKPNCPRDTVGLPLGRMWMKLDPWNKAGAESFMCFTEQRNGDH